MFLQLWVSLARPSLRPPISGWATSIAARTVLGPKEPVKEPPMPLAPMSTRSPLGLAL